jgi:HEPN domain-containing protein
MTQDDFTRKLLLKALQDMEVVERLAVVPGIAREIIGFHAQQVVEKSLKAVLAFHHIEFPYTHQIATLIECLTEHSFDFPDRFYDVRFLSPFAVEYRYDFLNMEETIFDVEILVQILRDLLSWAKDIVHF